MGHIFIRKQSLLVCAMLAGLLGVPACAAGVESGEQDPASNIASLEQPLTAEEPVATPSEEDDTTETDATTVDISGVKIEALQGSQETPALSAFSTASSAEHPYCSIQDGGYNWRSVDSRCRKCVDYWKPIARSFCSDRGGLLCYQCINNCDTEGPFKGIRFSCMDNG